MKFYGFNLYLIVSDEFDGIFVWNWIRGSVVNNFRYDEILRDRITDFQIINKESENSKLLVSSTSNIVAIYKNYKKKEELVISFKVVYEVVFFDLGLGILIE